MAHKNRWSVVPCHKSESFIIAFSYKDEHGVSRRYKRSAGRGATKREAEAKARALYLELEKDPMAFVERFVAPAQTKAHALPFRDVAATFLAEHVETRCRPSTRRTHEQMLRVHLVPAFGTRDLRDVRRPEVEAYVSQKLKAKLSPKSVANHVSVLSSLFDFAITREWTTENPTKLVTTPKLTDKGTDWLDADAAERFLAAVRERDPGHADLFLVALRTGMRQGELLALRWGDLRFTVAGPGDAISVRHSLHLGELGPTKGGKPRHVAMHPHVRATLLPRRGDDTAFVFATAAGAPLTGNIVKNPMRRAAVAIGKPDLRFHDLRHSFASQLVTNGVALQTVQKLLGHSDIQTTLRYAHLAPSALTDAVASLGGPASGQVLAFRRVG